MFTVRKTFRFEAAHKLPLHDGKCQRLHGHSWVMTVEVKRRHLKREGSETSMVMDFGNISKVVKPIVEEKLDHYHLNDTLPLENPTSEAVALWMFNELDDVIEGLNAVEIEETCTARARYERN